MTNLSRHELQRYARHLALREVGLEGQLRLKDAKVLVVGAGGLGSPVALYLAAAGVGTLGICDDDRVDVSNLQRQILHGSQSVGSYKVASAHGRLYDINPQITVIPLGTKVSADNALTLLNNYDIVVDGSDNFACRYILNDACYFAKKPLVSAAVMGFSGQLSVFHYQEGPCYRCLFPEPPPAEASPNCSELGVLGVLPGTMGCLQATEVLKIILGIGTVASKTLILYDALLLEQRSVSFERDLNCALCGASPTIHEVKAPLAQSCDVFDQHLSESDYLTSTCTPRELEAVRSQVTLIDVREPYEHQICSIEPSLNIPLAELSLRAEALPKDKPLIIYCKSGSRSAKAWTILKAQGIQSRSLNGGILAWIQQIDRELTKY